MSFFYLYNEIGLMILLGMELTGHLFNTFGIGFLVNWLFAVFPQSNSFRVDTWVFWKPSHQFWNQITIRAGTAFNRCRKNLLFQFDRPGYALIQALLLKLTSHPILQFLSRKLKNPAKIECYYFAEKAFYKFFFFLCWCCFRRWLELINRQLRQISLIASGQ